MVFWAGILLGAAVAWFAIKTGFYETWALAFNILISIYLAINLRPIIIDTIPAAGGTAYSNALTMMATATGVFLILHCISHTFLTGQFNLSAPKIFDTLGSGFLGFLSGLLVWSFVCLLICIMPISQQPIVKKIGFDRQSQQTNVSYLCWWCDLVNTVVSSKDNEYTTQEAIRELLGDPDKIGGKHAGPDQPETNTGKQLQPGTPERL